LAKGGARVNKGRLAEFEDFRERLRSELLEANLLDW
jgi:hypothetical protein